MTVPGLQRPGPSNPVLHPTWAQAHPTLPTPTRMADPALQHFGAVEDDEDDPYQGILQRRPRSPWVAVGAGLTASVLVAGLAAFRRGDRRMSQLMMRARVLAQVGGARAGGRAGVPLVEAGRRGVGGGMRGAAGGGVRCGALPAPAHFCCCLPCTTRVPAAPAAPTAVPGVLQGGTVLIMAGT